MAISGDSYCTSAYHGMLLNLKHCSQFYFAVEFSTIFVFIGKVFITCLNVVTFYCIIRYGTHTYDKVESALGPIIMVAIFSFVMAHIFLCQFEEGTLAMLQSYAIDMELNQGEPQFGPPNFHKQLDKVVGHH